MGKVDRRINVGHNARVENHRRRSWVMGAAVLPLLLLSAGCHLRSSEAHSTAVQASTETAETAAQRISWGNRVLLTGKAHPSKQAGAEALARQDYRVAITALEEARQGDPTDPETLIYLNNARLRDRDAYGIAVVVPVSAYPAETASLLRGIAQAQTRLNQSGGVRGTGVRIAIADEGDTSRVSSLATALAEHPDIIAVIGHDRTAAAAADVYDGQLAAILPTAAAVEPQGSLQSLAHSPVSAAAALADYADRIGHRTATLLYSGDSDTSVAFQEQFAEALTAVGGQVVQAQDIDSRSGRAAKAELIAFSLEKENVLEAAVGYVKTLDGPLRPQHLLADQALYQPERLEELGSLADGLILAVPDFLHESPASPFDEAAQALWQTPLTWHSAAGYAASQQLFDALRSAPDRRGIIRASQATPASQVQLVRVDRDGDDRYRLEPID